MNNWTKYVVYLLLTFITLIIFWEIYSGSNPNRYRYNSYTDTLLNNIASDPILDHISDLSRVANTIQRNFQDPVIMRVNDVILVGNTRNRSKFRGTELHFDDDVLLGNVIRDDAHHHEAVVSKTKSGVNSSMCTAAVDLKEMSKSNTSNRTSIMSYRTEPYPSYWVDIDAPLLYRIKIYNQALIELAEKIRKARGFQLWSDPDTPHVVLWGSHDDFLMQVSNFTNIVTLSLSWIRSQCSNRNLVITDYPEWTASEPLCTWIKTPGKTKARWDAVYNRSCTVDLDRGLVIGNLEPVYLHAKPINPDHYWPNNGYSYPSHFYSSPPPHVLYLQITQDAIITSVGDIFSGSVKLVPYSCSHDLNPSKPQNYDQMPIYSEVFVMSGHWGTGHFHKSIELIPRIVPYLDFLKKYPDIVVQVSETTGKTAETLNMLGVARERLVSGTVRSKIAYLPQATPCGFGQVQELQILSKLYRDHIHSMNDSSWKEQQQYLVMIHRSGMRRLSDALFIELMVQRLAKEYGLEFKLYTDQQLPSFEETMVMFNKAAIVIGPHGAGASNLMFCEPGTFFVEFVCNPPHVNMCYQRLAHVLGLRYHGIPSEDGCESYIKVNPKLVEFVVRVKLEQWKSLQTPH